MTAPTDRLSVTLEAQAWEAVMRILCDAPYKISAPLISEIHGQCLARRAAETPAASVSVSADAVEGR